MLYDRDLYWVEPHSEFRYGWAGFDDGIAEFAVDKDESKKTTDSFSFVPLTKPNVLVKIGYGDGYFLIDQVKWGHKGFNREKGLRYANSFLMYAGARVLGEGEICTDTAVIQAENMTCRTPGQPFISCRSHDYWTICRNNYVSEHVDFLSGGEYKITMRAKSRREKLIPVMGLGINKRIVGMLPVISICWNVYDFIVDLGKGEHEIGIYLLNSEDPYDEKYLYLDWVFIEKVSSDRPQK